MPNWTRTTVMSPKAAEMKARYCNEKGEFDFNKLFPMPAELDVEASSSNDYDIYFYLSERMTLPLEQVRAIPDSKLISNDFSKDWLAAVRDRITEGKAASYERGEILVSNYRRYGAPTWYEWCREHWGVNYSAIE